MVGKNISLSAHTVLRNREMRASSSSPVARQKLRGGWHDQLVHAAPCHWSSTGAQAKPMRAHTRAHTHTYAHTHTHTHRGADAHRWHSFTRALGLRERLTRYVGKFTVDDIYGHHIHWSNIHQIHGGNANCWSIYSRRSICLTRDFNKTQTDPASLLLLLLPLLFPLAVYSRSTRTHKRTHSRTDPSLQLPTVLYHIYPERIAELKMIHQSLAQLCDPHRGDPIFIQPVTYSKAVK